MSAETLLDALTAQGWTVRRPTEGGEARAYEARVITRGSEKRVVTYREGWEVVRAERGRQLDMFGGSP